MPLSVLLHSVPWFLLLPIPVTVLEDVLTFSVQF